MLEPGPHGDRGELYAKVLASGGPDGDAGWAVRIGLTSVSDDARALLDTRRPSPA